MESALNRFFDVSFYPPGKARSRAQIAYITVWLITLMFTAYAFLVPFRTGVDFEYLTYVYRAIRPFEYPLHSLGFIAFYAMFVATLMTLRRGALEIAAWLPAFMIYVGAVSIALQNNLAYAQNAYLLIPPLIMAGVLVGERGLLALAPLHFILLIVGFALYYGAERANTLTALALLLITSVVIIVLLYFQHTVLQGDRAAAEVESSRRRLQLAQLTTRIARNLSRSEDRDATLNELVEGIREIFPVMYHVQVFLIEETGRVAELVASTGEPGQKLLAREHSLPVGSLSVIGQVTQRQEPIVAAVGREGTIHRPNDQLPDTRLEVALPLNVGSRNIGALDLQSKQSAALSEEDLTALRAIADSIAISIENMRLLEEANQRLAENKDLLEQMSEAQDEVERLNRELTGTIWTDYLRGQDQMMSFNIDVTSDEENAVQITDEFTEGILEAVRRGDVVRREEDGMQIVAVPVRVRGEVIGAMEFEVEQELTSEDLDMLNEIGERFGLAAENNRLYENSQRIAQREALVNEIGARIQSANSVDATLAEAARSLRDALDAERVAIRLGTPASQPTQSNG